MTSIKRLETRWATHKYNLVVSKQEREKSSSRYEISKLVSNFNEVVLWPANKNGKNVSKYGKTFLVCLRSSKCSHCLWITSFHIHLVFLLFAAACCEERWHWNFFSFFLLRLFVVVVFSKSLLLVTASNWIGQSSRKESFTFLFFRSLVLAYPHLFLKFDWVINSAHPFNPVANVEENENKKKRVKRVKRSEHIWGKKWNLNLNVMECNRSTLNIFIFNLKL